MLSKNIKIRKHRTANLPVVTYGCETWPLTLREELKMLMNIITGKTTLFILLYNIITIDRTSYKIDTEELKTYNCNRS